MFRVKIGGFCKLIVVHVPQSRGLLKIFRHTFLVQITSAGVNSAQLTRRDAGFLA